ncbi:unnamed protein product [Linum trigynum]|uniref:Reverse transcriptase Ty1/copia-type domain-containing protein n=1 Tax=Linum trigynum TaxID=586398 RepID=A0AAV2FBZ6_9ROSI
MGETSFMSPLINHQSSSSSAGSSSTSNNSSSVVSFSDSNSSSSSIVGSYYASYNSHTNTSSDDSSPTPSPLQAMVPLRRSARANLGQPPPRMLDYVGYSAEPIVIPRIYAEAKGDPRWEGAMTEETNVLDANHTWDLVPRTLDMQVIDSRWVYTVKMHSDGTLERFKALVVAPRFKQ